MPDRMTELSIMCAPHFEPDSRIFCILAAVDRKIIFNGIFYRHRVVSTIYVRFGYTVRRAGRLFIEWKPIRALTRGEEGQRTHSNGTWTSTTHRPYLFLFILFSTLLYPPFASGCCLPACPPAAAIYCVIRVLECVPTRCHRFRRYLSQSSSSVSFAFWLLHPSASIRIVAATYMDVFHLILIMQSFMARERARASIPYKILAFGRFVYDGL